ncbi:MAG: YggU family protein [Desulfobacterales bacterium]|nr:YggU family protein [Desulfobacterales bacterium]MBF0396248.1 YggU family protein [Desulfobacterales bacterium]
MFIQENSEGITFKVFVQPKASKNEIVGIHGDALKIKITAPPVDGSANKMCIEYLSKYLGTKKSSLKIVSGETSRTKYILWNKGDKNSLQNILKIIHSKIQ